MDKVVFAILINIFITAVYCGYSLSCTKFPKNPACMIEYMSKDRWPHKERYYYNPALKQCVMMRWADYCQPLPPGENYFPSEDVCMNHCPGVPYQNCMLGPDDPGFCVIPDDVSEVFSNKKRYFYNCLKRKCEAFLWADGCKKPPRTANNFLDEKTCIEQCGE